MNILLLGATGYLGGNIAKKFINNGNCTFCVVRDVSDTSRIKKLGGSIISNNLEDIEELFKSNKIDWVINSACTYSPNDSLYQDMFVSNVFFPLSIMNLAIRYGVKNFITIGTNLPNEFNMYSFTKNKFGEFGKFICEQESINFADLRLEMFYGGEYEPYNRFIRSCITKLVQNENLELTIGNQKRDIIRVEDVIDIIFRIVVSEFVEGYRILAIGSGEHHTIREIMEFMKEKTNSKSKLLFGAIPSRNGEPDTLADISWYEELGYSLRYDYFQGLEKECLLYMK